MKTILRAIAEHDSGKVRRGSFEALALGGAARRPLGRSAGRGALLGHGVEPLAGELACRGADEVFLLEHELLAQYTPDACMRCPAGLVEELAPSSADEPHVPGWARHVAAGRGEVRRAAAQRQRRRGGAGRRGGVLRQPYDAKFVARTVDRGPAPRFATLQSGSCSADELPQDHAGGVTRRAAQIDPAARGGACSRCAPWASRTHPAAPT